ncbi:DUF3224 domain-containing protein [Bdellovibrio sp. NC01]|uniref:DUF3224 domain-containing protein n=1 Tax=Bdellovibrio sp. NC01 TaxID=2220073 RepID=UPI00115A37E5|nr:DUF3224 domain-containing protein [Bdellovibrio sp. NC01]QDK37314.1 DUF3224 domain-containing protein [Bdellovibrio sp. NC01]
MKTIKGSFEVKSTPLPADEVSQATGAMRMRFDKTFSGPFAATGVVSMMGILNGSSGGYVAIEKITGSIEGRSGSFCFQHSCTMDAGAQKQTIEVIPGTGNGELTNLKGEMTIEIVNGQHFYTFNYSIESGIL